MESNVWPQVPHEENPISYVTNGVHLQTFLAKEWMAAFDLRFGGEWRNKLRNIDYWKRIQEIPDHAFWSLRQSLKSSLLEFARRGVVSQLKRNNCSQAQINHITKHLAPDETNVLIIGFAGVLPPISEQHYCLLIRDAWAGYLMIQSGRSS